MCIAVSACLLGENCKYNGGNNRNDKVLEYCDGKEIIPICPEVAGGLLTPRSPVELIRGRAINKDGEDVTEAFQKGVKQVLSVLKGKEVEAVILQSRSPSCGTKQVYDGTFSGTLMPGMGMCAKALQDAGYRVIDVAEIK